MWGWKPIRVKLHGKKRERGPAASGDSGLPRGGWPAKPTVGLSARSPNRSARRRPHPCDNILHVSSAYPTKHYQGFILEFLTRDGCPRDPWPHLRHILFRCKRIALNDSNGLAEERRPNAVQIHAHLCLRNRRPGRPSPEPLIRIGAAGGRRHRPRRFGYYPSTGRKTRRCRRRLRAIREPTGRRETGRGSRLRRR